MNGSVGSQDLDHILSLVNFDPFRGKNVFITGGTGFFGKWILESLSYANQVLQLDCNVLALSRNPETFLKSNKHFLQYKNLSFLKGDIFNLE